MTGGTFGSAAQRKERDHAAAEKPSGIPASAMVLLFCTAAVYLAWLVQKPELIQTAARQGTYTCTAGTARGTIYDRNGVPLVNTKTACIAVVSPTPAAAEALLSHVTDTAAFYEKLAQGMPFTCTVDTADIDCPDVTILQIPQRARRHSLPST